MVTLSPKVTLAGVIDKPETLKLAGFGDGDGSGSGDGSGYGDGSGDGDGFGGSEDL